MNDTIIIFFEQKRSVPKLIIREMRVYQWVKNLLIFLPLLASHWFMDMRVLTAECIACSTSSLPA